MYHDAFSVVDNYVVSRLKGLADAEHQGGDVVFDGVFDGKTNGDTDHPSSSSQGTYNRLGAD